MPIQIAQSCAPAGKDHWKWSVWMDGTNEDLDGVDYVVYTLHPTFNEPVRRVDDRATAFRLDASGWGEFSIHADVHHHDGRVETLKHWLELDSAAVECAPTRGAPAPRIYLSFSLADAPAARAIHSALNQAGVEVSTSDEVADSDPGMPFEQVLGQQLKCSSQAVFLVSEHSSPWLRREAEMAGRMGIPRAFVTIGDSAPSGEEDPTTATLQVERLDAESAGEVARAIAHWVTNASPPAPVRVILSPDKER